MGFWGAGVGVVFGWWELSCVEQSSRQRKDFTIAVGSQERLGGLRELLHQWRERKVSAGDLSELGAVAEAGSGVAGQAVIEHGLPRAEDKTGYQGSSVGCRRGRKAKFVGYRFRHVGALFGAVQVWRGYYHCRHCQTGQAPWDRRQSLGSLMWAPVVKRVGRRPPVDCRMARRWI